jgi:organic hydroperoxide reductase OsmC/OhrA
MAEHPLPDEELDLIPEQTFPASDAACFMAAAAVVGSSPHNLPPSGSRPAFGALFSAQAGERVSDR